MQICIKTKVRTNQKLLETESNYLAYPVPRLYFLIPHLTITLDELILEEDADMYKDKSKNKSKAIAMREIAPSLGLKMKH